MDMKFYVTITLEMPFGDEENKNLEEIKIVDVAHTPPPFKATGDVKHQNSVIVGKKTTAGGQTVKETPKQSETKEVAIPEGVGPDELKDIDVQRNLWS